MYCNFEPAVVEHCTTPLLWPQLLIKAKDWMRMARAREKAIVPKLLVEIQALEKEIRSVSSKRGISDTERSKGVAALTSQVRKLKQKRVLQLKSKARARHRLEGERPTKYWTGLHREVKPRDVMYALEKDGERRPDGSPVYETDSNAMADLARKHHENLQRDECGMKPPEQREEDIQAVLDSIDAKLSPGQAAEMSGLVTYDECELALRFSKSASSPGLDGITYEVWKTLHARHIEDSRHESRATLDVLYVLCEAFKDIQLHGVAAAAGFNEGWMCPIYKEKGEKTKIVNYRPITLMNTDYKLLSKTLSIRLASVAEDIIHPSQAGFVPGRRLRNHTQLARMMIDWAEITESNGAIVALDQEKAYDKVAHDYLWRVLETFGVPEDFITTVRSLYTNANTSVMINGVPSKPYCVYRGVRQGDPMSCLLFDLAIEPLSAMIRKSELRGFNIPGTVEAVKATLFADDTTVYLTEDDDFSTLQNILDVWCSAAKARFNIRKTEIIPIGERTYRDRVAETYKLAGTWKNYPAGVRMAAQGEPVRVLGAFIGNGVEQVDVWTPTLEKVSAVLERWQRGISTIEGRRHVVQMFIGGMTQFLTDVQCMPKQVCKRLERILRGYLWNDRKRPPVSMEQVCAPFENGGLGILDLEARNDAIDIMWLRAYLDFNSDRPMWAYIADDIFARTVTLGCTARDETVRMNPLLQSWRPKVLALPRPLQAMIQVSEKYNLRVEGLAFSRSILRGMPMWYHIHGDKEAMTKLTRVSNAVRCLRDRHELRVVGDFEAFANNFHAPGHLSKTSCKCAGCELARNQDGCEKPYLCAERAKSLLDTLPPKWDPRGEHPCDYEEEIYQVHKQRAEEIGNGLVPFDRRISTAGNVGEAFRIFTSGNVSNERLNTEEPERTRAYAIAATDGSCLKNGQADASAGAGVYFGPGDPRNVSVKLPATLQQSNQTGEAVASLLATKAVPDDTPLVEETDSETVMKSVTTWLRKHEDAGYTLQRNATETRALVAALRSRKAVTMFRWIKGHDGHEGNEMADQLAGQGARKAVADEIDVVVPEIWKVSGCKLSKITQKIAYHAIKQKQLPNLKKRERTEANMKKILDDLKVSFGKEMAPHMIWTSLRGKHISRECRQFLWMSIHDGYMVGDKWLRPKMSDELRARAPCGTCGDLETMEHILFNCRAVGREAVWELLEETWELTGRPWVVPGWGTLGAGCASFPSDSGDESPSVSALWTILVSESLYFIWKMRCERVIRNEGREFTTREVTRRWYSTIDRRLELDRRSCAKYLGPSALSAATVARIWEPVLHPRGELPHNWVTDSGVLVGIRRGR